MDVMHADLRHYREFPQCPGVGIAGDVPESLVPDVAAAVLPTVRDQDGMDGGPACFGVPEPQRRLRGGISAPRLDVRFVPFDQGAHRMTVPGEAAHSVWPVGNDARWSRPIRVQALGATEVDRCPTANVLLAGDGLPRRFLREHPELRSVRDLSHPAVMALSHGHFRLAGSAASRRRYSRPRRMRGLSVEGRELPSGYTKRWSRSESVGVKSPRGSVHAGHCRPSMRPTQSAYAQLPS